MRHESRDPDSKGDGEYAELLAEAREGSRACLADLLHVFRPYLKRIAHQAIDRGVRPKEGSSDLVQKTLFEGQLSFSLFQSDDPAALRLWLRAILLNNLHDLHRHYLGTQKRDVSRERSLNDFESQQRLVDLAVSQTESPSQRLSRAEESQRAQQVLATLKPEYQEAIVLRYQDDLTFAEIGALIGKSPGAAEQLVKRAVYKFGVSMRKMNNSDGLP